MLALGEVLPASAQDVPDPIERVVTAAAVAVDLLLDPTPDVVDDLGGEHDQLEDARSVLDAFHVVKVRHEALCVRMEVRDLHRLVVAAAGLKLRAA